MVLRPSLKSWIHQLHDDLLSQLSIMWLHFWSSCSQMQLTKPDPTFCSSCDEYDVMFNVRLLVFLSLSFPILIQYLLTHSNYVIYVSLPSPRTGSLSLIEMAWTSRNTRTACCSPLIRAAEESRSSPAKGWFMVKYRLEFSLVLIFH